MAASCRQIHTILGWVTLQVRLKTNSTILAEDPLQNGLSLVRMPSLHWNAAQGLREHLPEILQSRSSRKSNRGR
jgi:hypothetical protein